MSVFAQKDKSIKSKSGSNFSATSSFMVSTQHAKKTQFGGGCDDVGQCIVKLDKQGNATDSYESHNFEQYASSGMMIYLKCNKCGKTCTQKLVPT